MRTHDAQLRRQAWCVAIGVYIVIVWFLALGFRVRREVLEIKIFSGPAKPVVFSGHRGSGRGGRHLGQRPNGSSGVQSQPVAPAPEPAVKPGSHAEAVPIAKAGETKPVEPVKAPVPEPVKPPVKPMVDDSRRVIEPPAAKKLGKRAEALAQKKLEAAKKAEQAKKAAEEKTTLEKAEKEAAQKAAEEVKLAREKQAQAKKDAEEAAKLEREKQEQTKRAQKRAQEEAAAAKAMADKQAKLARAQQTAAATSGASAGKPGIKPEEFFISGNPDLAIAPPGATADDDGDGEGFGDGSEGGMSRDGVALINSIGRTWRPPRGLSPMLSARAEVTLAGNGSAEDIKIVEGSGVLAYDMAVRASLLRTEYPRAFWGKTIAVVFGKMPAR